MISAKDRLIKELDEEVNRMREQLSTEDFCSAINDFNRYMEGVGFAFVVKKKKGKRCLKKIIAWLYPHRCTVFQMYYSFNLKICDECKKTYKILEDKKPERGCVK